MDYSALVAEIVSRVAAKMDETAAPEACETCSGKEKLLVLTQEHGDICHTILESKALAEHYQVECALLQDYNVDINDYVGVVLFGMTNGALARIATGLGGTPYTDLVSKAILLGKSVWLPRQQVELLNYTDSSPAPYYDALHARLDLLVQSGVTLCETAELENTILGCAPCATCAPAAPACPAAAPCKKEETPAPAGGEYAITKKVITEKDINAAQMENASIIRVGAKAILTDLAKEYAHTHGMTVVRD